MKTKKPVLAVVPESEHLELKARYQSLVADNIKANSERGAAMADKSELQKLTRQLEVISLMSEGRLAEAIQSVLRKDVMLFRVEVRFADDHTRQLAEAERFNSVIDAVKVGIENLRKPKPQGKENQ